MRNRILLKKTHEISFSLADRRSLGKVKCLSLIGMRAGSGSSSCSSSSGNESTATACSFVAGFGSGLIKRWTWYLEDGDEDSNNSSNKAEKKRSRSRVNNNNDSNYSSYVGHTGSVTRIITTTIATILEDGGDDKDDHQQQQRNVVVMVSASKDKTIKLWDIVSGVCLKTLEGHTAAVTDICETHIFILMERTRARDYLRAYPKTVLLSCGTSPLETASKSSIGTNSCLHSSRAL